MDLRVLPTDPPSHAVRVQLHPGQYVTLTAPPATSRDLAHLVIRRREMLMFIPGHTATPPECMLQPADELLATVRVPAREAKIHASQIKDERARRTGRVSA